MPRTPKKAASSPAEPSALLLAPQLPKLAGGPSRQEWSALYEAAVRFRDAAPWEWVSEDQNFGVQDPETGDVGYCCVTGGMGEHFALVVYRGTRGLSALWAQRMGPPPELIGIDNLLEIQDCLMASFEDREEIEPKDREIMKALGLKFRGRNAWPLFRSFLPGTFPWYLTAAEARYLTLCLEQALLVVEAVQTEPDLIPMSELTEPYLVRVRDTGEGGAGTWRNTLLVPAPVTLPELARPIPDSAVIARLRALPKSNAVLEMEKIRLPEPVQSEPDTRPMLPYLMLAVAAVPPSPVSGKSKPVPAKSGPRSRRVAPQLAPGMVVGNDIVLPDEAPQRFAEILTEAIENIQALPESVAVRRPDNYAYLELTAQALGITLTLKEDLPGIDDALESVMGFFGGGALELLGMDEDDFL